MARFRRRRRSGGGGGGNSRGWGGQLLIVFGCVAMIVSLIMFSIGIDQLDAAIDAVNNTGAQFVGLEDIMNVSGLIVFLAFVMLGLAAVGGGAYLNIRARMSGSWMDLLMLAVFGGITLIIALIMNTITLTQLNTAIATINATGTTFVGLYDVARVFGLVIFLALLSAALGQLAGAGYGAYKNVRG